MEPSPGLHERTALAADDSICYALHAQAHACLNVHLHSNSTYLYIYMPDSKQCTYVIGPEKMTLMVQNKNIYIFYVGLNYA